MKCWLYSTDMICSNHELHACMCAGYKQSECSHANCSDPSIYSPSYDSISASSYKIKKKNAVRLEISIQYNASHYFFYVHYYTRKHLEFVTAKLES